jgi:hypothetical protein
MPIKANAPQTVTDKASKETHDILSEPRKPMTKGKQIKQMESKEKTAETILTRSGVASKAGRVVWELGPRIAVGRAKEAQEVGLEPVPPTSRG